MDKINANLTRMPQVQLIGIPVLMTSERIDRSTIHWNLYCYELERTTDIPEYPLRLVKEAGDNFSGSIISAMPLLLQGVPTLPIQFSDIQTEPNGRLWTPAEYEDLYSVQQAEAE